MDKSVRDGVRPQASTPRQAKTSSPIALLMAGPTQEDIARRAYEKFCERGCQHGHDRQDWLAAEQELAAKMR
jgi:hypothetical protein